MNGTYKYGFNGKENDSEVKGEGNQQDYGERIYDVRIGRLFSVDLYTKRYAMLSPYQFASNRPIDGIDRNGLEWTVITTSKFDESSGYLTKETEFTLKLRVVNRSNVVTSSVDINNASIAIKDFIENKFKISKINEDSKEIIIYKTNVILDNTPLTANSISTTNNGFWLYFNDQKEQLNQQTGQTFYLGGQAMPGYVNGYTQHNKIDVSLAFIYLNGNSQKRSTLDFTRSAAHEVGHSGGLPHPWMKAETEALQIYDMNQYTNSPAGLSSKDQRIFIASLGAYVKQNLMNSGANPDQALASSSGLNVTFGQLQSMQRTIEKDRSNFLKNIETIVRNIRLK